jgi:hypothetical protein
LVGNIEKNVSGETLKKETNWKAYLEIGKDTDTYPKR